MPLQVAPVNVRVLKTTASLVVSAAAGGVGQAVADTSESLYIAIRNTDLEGCEYKVGAGSWLPLGSRSVANLDVDLSATTVYLRKAPSAPNVTVAIEVSKLTSEYMVGDDSANITGGAAVQALVSSGGNPPNTIYTIGDSFSAFNLAVVGNTFVSRQTEGAFNWFDWLLGAPFNYVGNLGVGGKTAQQMIDEQLPTIINARPRYVWITCGHNDLYNEFVGETVTYNRTVTALETLMNAGITPIWSTLWHRSFSATYTPQHVRLNDMLRRYAFLSGAGLFYDGASITNDPSSANNEGRLPLAEFYYDSTIHPNNLLSMRIGQFAAQALGNRIFVPPSTSVGNEGVTIATAGSNLLSNPSFQGTAGTVSANCTGTMPDGWVIDWLTRTGTGSAAAAIVNVTDSATGLVTARAIQVTISGAPANADVLRITQTNTQNAALATGLTTGNLMQAEGVVSLATGAAVVRIDMRVEANSSESTWCGVPNQTPVSLPATIPPLTYRTYPITVLGAGAASQARYDVRMRFNGDGGGSVLTLWRPRVRRVS